MKILKRLAFWKKPPPRPRLEDVIPTLGYERPPFYHHKFGKPSRHGCNIPVMPGQRVFVPGKTHEQIARELYAEHGKEL